MPSSSAFLSFEPAPGPATTRSVLALTEPAARAPFDLIIANILAGPLIELAPDFASALTPGGSIILAGLLDSQADGVAAAYEKLGLSVVSRGAGEWPVLVLRA
jgi:ribosomal protein L11 methyltransferase